MKKLSRRSFLATSIASSALVLSQQAAAQAKQESKNESAQNEPMWDRETDVVVLGCGAAGLMAALQAIDGGAKVEIFDKGLSPYHTSTRLNGGLFAACGSKIQKEKGVKDSPEDFAKNINDYGDGISLMEPVLTYAKNSGAAFDWLIDNGLKMGIWQHYAGHYVPRSVRNNSYNGKEYVDVLVNALEKRGQKINHDQGVVRFFLDPERKTVIGVECGNGSNNVKVKANKGVVVATGGITGSAHEVSLWSPLLGNAVVIGGGSNDGSAMRTLLRDCSTPLTHMQYFAEYPYARVLGKGRGPQIRYQYFVDNGGNLVSKTGKRFVNESLAPTQISPFMKQEPGQAMYLIMNQEIFDKTAEQYPMGSLVSSPQWDRAKWEKELKAGRVATQGDTLEEACKKWGIDVDELKKQVAEWNDIVKNQKDTQFGRTNIPQYELKDGPYIVTKVDLWVCLSMGGLKCNKNLQVLGWDEKPINHLYAAGETVGGIHGAHYLGGDACGFAHTSGYVVGRLLTGQPVTI